MQISEIFKIEAPNWIDLANVPGRCLNCSLLSTQETAGMENSDYFATGAVLVASTFGAAAFTELDVPASSASSGVLIRTGVPSAN